MLQEESLAREGGHVPSDPLSGAVMSQVACAVVQRGEEHIPIRHSAHMYIQAYGEPPILFAAAVTIETPPLWSSRFP